MRSLRAPLLPVSLLLFGLLCAPLTMVAKVFAAEPTKSSLPADSPLVSVLRDEAAGKAIDRRDALSALNLPKSAEQRWQAGHLQHGSQWLAFETLPHSSASTELNDYRIQRGDNVLDADGHRRLAQWCRHHDLLAQERAHWHGVLLTQPDNKFARTMLGHEWIGDRWFTTDQLVEADRKSTELVAQWEKWMPRLKRIVVQLQSSNSKVKQAAIDELASISDPNAISSLEITCMQVEDEIAMPILKTIARFKSEDACLGLARISLNFVGDSRGNLAMSELKEYPPSFYIPELLSLLNSPISLQSNVENGAGGHLVLAQAMFRETKDEKQIQLQRIHNIVSIGQPRLRGLNFIRAPRPDRVVRGAVVLQVASSKVPIRQTPELHTASVRDLEQVARQFESEISELNRVNQELCQACCHVLSNVTGQSIEDNPQAWWDWWQDYNERYSGGQKPVRFYDDNRIAKVRRFSEAYVSLTVTRPFQTSCLVRGSLVQTVDGLKAIEKIRIGDLVLSQDVETGELALKPVLQTTVRPPKSTLRIVTESGEIQATGGHRWWVPGKGWLKTRDLVAGMTLHNATGTTLIKNVVEDPKEQETYNLVVDGFHTYFVGEDRVLSYDNTDLKPTLRTVPGYGVL